MSDTQEVAPVATGHRRRASVNTMKTDKQPGETVLAQRNRRITRV